MENRNTELEEMKKQIELLRKKLDGQEIVNKRVIRSMHANFFGLHRKLAILCICCACMAPSLFRMIGELGFSTEFKIATCVMICFALCMVVVKMVALSRCRKVTDMDLVTANIRLHQLRVFFVKIKYFGIPVAAIWIGWFAKEAFALGGSAEYIGLGVLAGGIAGIILGLIINRRIVSGADRILEEIKTLQES